MIETLSAPDIISLLQHAARGLSQSHERVGELDALTGDGDLGVTAELVSKAIDQCTTSSEANIGELLMNCGAEINRRSPSTFGTLLASAFNEVGKSTLGRSEIKTDELVAFGRRAIDGIRKRGKSDIGEKTMLDCIVPAVDALGHALTNGVGTRAAIKASIEAAKMGAMNTTMMAATHGRAAYRQDRAVGMQDAGASAVFYMLESAGNALIELLGKKLEPPSFRFCE